MDIITVLSSKMISPLVAYKNNQKHFQYLRKTRNSQYLPIDELKKYQSDQLTKLVIHAYDNVPFYKSRLNNVNINPHKDSLVDYFHHIPLLTKSDIQNHLPELSASNLAQNSLVPNKTGGSTGKPIHYFHDKDRVDFLKAIELRHNEWAGWSCGDKIGVLWGARQDINTKPTIKDALRKALVDRFLILDTSSLTEEKMVKFAHDLNEFRPKGLLAYANSLYEFAKFIDDNSIKCVSPHSIITSAEILHEHERTKIEKVFGCKIYNRYGCREVAVIASECEAHNGLHVAADSLYLEVLKDDGAHAEAGEEGDIIITDMFNIGMPFIRYRIEDRGVFTDRKCPCGRTLPLIESVTGRTTDFLITPEGVKVSGASITIYLIANARGIKQAQFIQDKRNEIVLKLVKGNDYSDETLKYLSAKMPDFFGNNLRVIYEFVEEIPKTSSGKYRFSICNVNQTSE